MFSVFSATFSSVKHATFCLHLPWTVKLACVICHIRARSITFGFTFPKARLCQCDTKGMSTTSTNVWSRDRRWRMKKKLLVGQWRHFIFIYFEIANKIVEILSKLFLSITKWQLPLKRNILWEQTININV